MTEVAIKRYRFNDTINRELKALCALDNWHGLLAVLIDYLVILAAIGAVFYSYWFYPLAWLIIGARQRALATILHESVHSSLAKNKTLNHVLGTYFSGFLLFQSFSLYAASHVKKHHAFLGNKSLDPDYKYHLELNLYGPHEKSIRIRRWPKLINVFFTYASYLVKHRIGIFNDASRDALVGRCYLAVLFIGIWYLGYFNYLFVFWLFPLMSSFLIIGWFLELSEHFPMVHTESTDLYMTRNRFSHWLERFFLSIHNENYHLVHHLRARIPFWNMKKAHRILMQDVNYRKINNTMGGVFISANKNEPVISIFLSLIRSNTRVTIK